MVRRYDEPVEVRRRDDDPEQFLWRGRLHVVREVLAHWVEAGCWWHTPAAAAITSGDVLATVGAPAGDADLELTAIPSSPRWAQRAWGEPAPDLGGAAGPAGVDDREREMWRVEASTGRCGSTGMFDLCLDWSTGGWTLVRCHD